MTDRTRSDTERSDNEPSDSEPSGVEPGDGEPSGTGRSGADGSDGDRAEPSEESSTPDRRLDRRALIRAGAAGVAAALAGCGGDSGGDDVDDPEPEDTAEDGEETGDSGNDTDDGPPDDDAAEIPYADEYGTVVDVVADGGADPEGDESIVPILDVYADDDTLLYFPPGEYLVDELWKIPVFEHLGVVGDDATIVPQRGNLGYLLIFGVAGRGATDLHVEGLEFDFTAEDTAPRPLQAQIQDGLIVEDITVRGSGGTARFDLTSPDGEGVVRNLRMPDGGREPNPVGVLVESANVGRLRFEDCHLEGFPGNGLYASPSNGPIEVVGGTYANNGIASVRVSSPATVRDVTVRCDEAPEGFRNMRGIRLRHGESVHVENCTIEMSDLTYSDGALVIEPMMESATIQDVDIDVSVDDTPAVNLRTPERDVETTSLSCDGVSVSGSASGGAAVRVVDRNECTLSDFDVQQTGADRDGIHLIRSSDCMLRDSEIDVPGEPIVLKDSNVRRVNTEL